MTETQILAACTRILRDLIGDDTIDLTPQTRRGDVAGWDSFMYVSFIVALALELGIRFGVGDVESFETGGDIVREVRAIQG